MNRRNYGANFSATSQAHSVVSVTFCIEIHSTGQTFSHLPQRDKYHPSSAIMGRFATIRLILTRSPKMSALEPKVAVKER